MLSVAGASGCQDAPTLRPEREVFIAAESGARSAQPAPRAPVAPASLSAVASSDAPVPSASPSTSALAEAPDPPLTPEQKELMNEKCAYRRSTNKLASCVASGAPGSAWRPSADEVAVVFNGTASMAGKGSGGCYCAWGLAPVARACAAKVGTGAIEMQIGTDGDDTKCTVTVEGFRSSDGRKFVRLNAFNQDGATMYGTLIVHELLGRKGEYYVGGFNEINARLFTLPAGDPDADFASTRARAEWPTLPADLKSWLAG